MNTWQWLNTQTAKMATLKSLFAIVVAIMLIFSGLMVFTPAVAAPNENASDKGKANAKVSIPEDAVKVAPGVYSLGQAVSQGKIVDGFMFIDYKKGFGHNPRSPPNHGGGGNGDDTSKCFAYLAKDAKWKSVEPWIVNPANARGLDTTFVFENLVADIQEWEDAAGLSEGSAEDILGDGSTTTSILVADTSSPDDVNEVYFADVDSSGAIAVTIVWGIFNAPPPFRELVEWDQVYDDVDFDWSSSGEAGKMDFENIAQHELGHSVGMGHPPDSCTDETMYAFASAGETKKRDLNTGDITGIDSLY